MAVLLVVRRESFRYEHEGEVVPLILVIVPLLAAGVIVYGTNSRVLVQEDRRALISQSGEWVPFSAETTFIDENGKVHHARIYRAADGSERTESFYAKSGEIYGIMIKNIPRVKFYSFLTSRGWTEQPMLLPPAGWHPTPRGASSSERTGEIIEGLEVVRTDRENSFMLQAPQLNMYPLVTEVTNCAKTGRPCTSRVFNIKIGEPGAHLFEPPPDAPVQYIAEPGGIVYSPKGNPRPRL